MTSQVRANTLSAMLRAIFLTACAGLLGLTAGCGGGSSTTADAAAIKARSERWSKAGSVKDSASFASFYADDAILLNSGVPAAKGKDAIRAAWKDMLSDPNSKLVFASSRIDVSSSGDMASTTGSYTMTMTNPKTKKPVEDKGSYLTVYKKQADGNWKAIEDVASSEIPLK